MESEEIKSPKSAQIYPKISKKNLFLAASQGSCSQNEKILIKAESTPIYTNNSDKCHSSQLSFTEFLDNKSDYLEANMYSSKSDSVNEINLSHKNEVNFKQNGQIQEDFCESSRRYSVHEEKGLEFGSNEISFYNIPNFCPTNQFISSPSLRKSKFFIQKNEDFSELPINQEDKINIAALKNSVSLELENGSIDIDQKNLLNNNDSIQISQINTKIPPKIQTKTTNNSSNFILNIESGQENIKNYPSSHILNINTMINNNLICKIIYKNIKVIVNELLNNEYSKSKFYFL